MPACWCEQACILVHVFALMLLCKYLCMHVGVCILVYVVALVLMCACLCMYFDACV